MNKKKWVIAGIIMAISVITIFCFYRKEHGHREKIATSNAVFTIHEEWWASKKQSRQSGNKDYCFDTVKKGDTVYDHAGYKLIVQDIYRDGIVLKQKGGLVEANKNGNLNAMASAQDTYTVKKNETVKLRSYSLRSGVILTITY